MVKKALSRFNQLLKNPEEFNEFTEHSSVNVYLHDNIYEEITESDRMTLHTFMSDVGRVGPERHLFLG